MLLGFCCYFCILFHQSLISHSLFLTVRLSQPVKKKCYYLALCTCQLHLFHIIIVPGAYSVVPTLRIFLFSFSPSQSYFNMHGNHVAEGGRVGRIALSLSLYYALPS